MTLYPIKGDNRYQVRRVHRGRAKADWCAYFCDELIGAGTMKVDAFMIALAHCDERKRAMESAA